MSLLEKLAEKNVIDPKDIPSIEAEIQKSEISTEEVLSQMGVDENDILTARGEDIGIPVKKIDDTRISKEILEYIPEESAQHYKLFPLDMKDGVLEVGIVDPDNIEARDALNFISSKTSTPFKIFLISQKDFEKLLEMYHGLTGEVTEALGELENEIAKEKSEEPNQKKSKIIKELEKSEGEEVVETKIIEDAPVTKIVATILRYATEGGASDIHLEHTQDAVRVRYRIDGKLATSIILPRKVQSAVIARIKILSNMRLDEKRKPQDGRFSAKIEGRRIDFRVSTFPTYYGEKVVIRILDHEKGIKNLDQLGISEKNLKYIREAINEPYGLVLISGPTGSGKTTTLYAMLDEVDKETKNVLSLEDPVEYNIEGVNQSQVKPEIGYTFANGLRTTLRQDPDIIMVGEIRDAETARLAIQAALTGHLVLSTIHTNNAFGVIPRLLDMGVDSYLIAPTLILSMAQRLVAHLCPDARKERNLDEGLKLMIEKQFEDLPDQFRTEIPKSDKVYDRGSSAGCPEGIQGRIAVMEVIPMTKELKSLSIKKPTEREVYDLAREQGMITMKEDAIIKAMEGVVPFDEVNNL